MSLRNHVVTVVTVFSLVSLVHDAAAEDRHGVAQTTKSDRSRPAPTPPRAPTAPAPTAAPIAPAPVAPAPVDPASPSVSPPVPPPALVAPVSTSSADLSAPVPPPSVPAVSPVQIGGRNEHRYVDEDRNDDGRGPNWLLFGVGTALLGTAWIATGATTAAICDGKCKESEDAIAWVPLVGPPIVGAVGKPSGGQIAALTASFVTQTAGLTLMIVGLATKGPQRSESRSLYVAPQVGATGMVLGGTF